MTIQDTNGTLTLVPDDTTEDVFLAVGHRSGITNTYVHVGGGLYICHNHRQSYSENPIAWTKSIGHNQYLDGGLTISRSSHINYYLNENDEIVDFSTIVTNNNADAPYVPLLIAADPTDLLGAEVVQTGITANNTDTFDQYYSTGTITEVDLEYFHRSSVDSTNSGRSPYYITEASVSGGMSGGALNVYLDPDADGEFSYYAIGALSRGGSRGGEYTSFTTTIYEQIAGDLEVLGVDADDIPMYTLMSGVNENSSAHEVQGTYLNEMLVGGSYHDTLQGNGGDDVYIGNDGNDTFIFSTSDGSDIIRDFVSGEDTLVIDGQTLSTSADLSAADISTTEANGDLVITYGSNDQVTLENVSLSDFDASLSATENDDHLIGYMGSDNISALGGDDIINGRSGDDIINGNNGDDILIGGGGSDRLDGGSGSDTASYEGSGDAVNVDLASGWWIFTSSVASGGDAEGDTLISIENLTGSDHNDTLSGGGGVNIIEGGAGDDILLGRGGEDIFVFRTGDGADTIQDFADSYQFLWFTVAGDTLQIDIDGYDSFSDLDTIMNDTSNGVLIDFGNGDEILLSNQSVQNLSADDFSFI